MGIFILIFINFLSHITKLLSLPTVLHLSSSIVDSDSNSSSKSEMSNEHKKKEKKAGNRAVSKLRKIK